MGVDKFGRHTGVNRGPTGRPGIGFNLDSLGNFDISDKRITNLSHPINDNDASTKQYVDEIKTELIIYILELIKTKENVKTVVSK